MLYPLSYGSITLRSNLGPNFGRIKKTRWLSPMISATSGMTILAACDN